MFSSLKLNESRGQTQEGLAFDFLVVMKEQEGVLRKIACMVYKQEGDRQELNQKTFFFPGAGSQGREPVEMERY